MKNKKQKSTKVYTVNVIELVEGDLMRVTSFIDTPDGNKEAEALFIKILKETIDIADEDIDSYVEDGYCNFDSRRTYIAHSNLDYPF